MEKSPKYSFDPRLFDLTLQFVVESERISTQSLRIAQRLLSEEIKDKIGDRSLNGARSEYLSRCRSILEICNTTPLRKGETRKDRAALLLKAQFALTPATAIRIIQKEILLREEIANSAKLFLLNQQEVPSEKVPRVWAYRWKEEFEEQG